MGNVYIAENVIVLTVENDEQTTPDKLVNASFTNLGSADATLTMADQAWILPSNATFNLGEPKSGPYWNAVKITALTTKVQCVYYK